MNEAIEQAINEAATPSDSDYLRCREAISRLLAGGELVDAETLVSAVARAEELGIPQSGEKVQFSSRSPKPSEIADDPLVRGARWRVAGMWALAEMVARGHVVGCETPSGAQVPSLKAGLTIPWDAFGSSSGARITVPLPRLPATHYRAARPLGPDSPSYVDPDIFMVDLATLELDSRTQRCLVEALDAWRRGLYLATANMLGAAFEGAWMAAGARLRDVSPSIAEAVDAEPPRVATVQKQTAGLFESRGMRLQADELRSHSALLRDLRNYGVHPKPVTDERLERYLDEATSGLLVLTTHHHLVGLAEATASVLDPSSA